MISSVQSNSPSGLPFSHTECSPTQLKPHKTTIGQTVIHPQVVIFGFRCRGFGNVLEPRYIFGADSLDQ